MNQEEQRFLPIVKIGDTEYLVDIEHREFRDFKNSENVVNMHSEKGRQIIKQCLGGQWHSYGIERPTIRPKGQEAITCSCCGHVRPSVESPIVPVAAELQSRL